MFMKLSAKYIISFLTVLALLFPPVTTGAEDNTIPGRPVRVGVLHVKKDTNPHGRQLLERHIRAYLRELSKRTHLGYEYIPVHSGDGRKMLADGTLDLLVPVQGNTALSPSQIYSEGYSVYGMLSLFTIPGSRLNILDSSTMNGISIGYVSLEDNSGYINHYVRTQGWENVNFITYADGQNMIEALHKGEIQAAMDDGSHLQGNEIELAIIAITQCQFMALPANQRLILELNNAILDTELQNPSFGTALEQEYIDPAIHSIATYSEREQRFIATAMPIRLVLVGEFPPFIDANSGIFKDIVAKMCEDSGLSLKVMVAKNSQEARNMLDRGEADIMPFVYSGDFTETPRNYTNNFMTAEYSAVIHEYTTFIGTPKTMVIPANIPGLKGYLKQQYPGWDIAILDTVEDCLDAVENHKYTIAMVPNLYLVQHSSLVTRSRLRISDTHSCHIGLSLMAGEYTPDMLTQVLNTAIQRLSPDEVRRIIKNNSRPVLNPGYLLQEYPIQMVAVMLLTLIIILGVGFMVHRTREAKRHSAELQAKNDELEQALRKVKVLTKDRDAYKQESETDPLTGLLNKKGIALRCQELLNQQKDGESVALLIIDLDHFKEFNDTYGHQMGDELLIAFAKILKTACTDLTAAGRFGGDEFMMMVTLPSNFTAAEIKKQAQWLLTDIKDMMVGGHAANVTGSIGIAVTNETGTSYDFLFRQADRALYKVKDAGRNGFQIYEKK